MNPDLVPGSIDTVGHVARGNRAAATPRDLSATDEAFSPWMLPVLCAAAFLLFVQAFMVAPLIPRLAMLFGTTEGTVALAVPSYLIPYGLATLVWGPLSDRIGRRVLILSSLGAFVVVTACTATADGVVPFVSWRVAAGVGASAVVPISVSLIGDLVPFRERGRALGWLFGALAGGIAVGSTIGALLESLVGWRGLFIGVAALAAVVAIAAYRVIPASSRAVAPSPGSSVLRRYLDLLATARGRRTYTYVGINAIVQSGVYTWMGVYLQRRFALGPTGIGLVLLGYGLPGFVLGPLIGRLADRHGRSAMIPLGLAVSAAMSLGLALPVPLGAVVVFVAALSLGYDLTQPLLAGIVTDLPGNRGQSTGLMAFVLFVGFGLGSLLFQMILVSGFSSTLVFFAAGAAVAAVVGVGLFRHERWN